jgi:hypothetical protein
MDSGSLRWFTAQRYVAKRAGAIPHSLLELVHQRKEVVQT